MAIEESEAIVLRVVEFSESSCVVTLFTKDFGKIGALAKGARRKKSPFEGAIDLLVHCRILFLHKSSDALDLLTEARLERRFRSASEDLSRLYAGYYVAELLDLLTHEGDPYPELFDLANQTLVAIDEKVDLIRTIVRFELLGLRILGHLPSLTECTGCGERVEVGRRVAFSQLAGGVICPECKIGQRQLVSVQIKTIQVMRAFSEPDDATWRNTEIPVESRGELRAVLNHYINHLIGHRPKLQVFLDDR